MEIEIWSATRWVRGRLLEERGGRARVTTEDGETLWVARLHWRELGFAPP